ncbi:MAG: ferrous iron transport protein B [Actinobacteria bacterium]|nr:ferrous iron transport protein B [Actinomycetota bacterium]
MEKIKVLIIGQPNTGKSTLLNALIGTKVIISNYPGTSVEITSGKKIVSGVEIEFSDTPGIYSISDRSEEEKVTGNALFEEKVDAAVVIADAMSIERSLYIILQIMEARIPTIVAVNFVEEAEKKGIKIDFKRLEKILSIPVLPINPLTKKGINKLTDKILANKISTEQYFDIRYDDHIEDVINEVSAQVRGDLPVRFVSLRVLEGDEDFKKYLKRGNIVEKIKAGLKSHPEVSNDISITRYGTASFIAEEVVEMVSLESERRLQSRIDKIILHKILGPTVTIIFLIMIFGILLYLGNFIQGFLMNSSGILLGKLSGVSQSIISIILISGLEGLVAGISIALPYVFLFYFIFGLLEDVGFLPRFVINVERFTKKIGLPGKAFIPLALGMGCTAPATTATRVLANKKEQFHTAIFFGFVPCSSRIAIIMGIVGFYGGVKLALYVFATLIIAGLVLAVIIKKFAHTKIEPLILELPTYRRPILKNVFAKSWLRMKEFVYLVIPLLVAGGIVYGILNLFNISEIIVRPFSFITTWLGLPSVTIIPLVFGFLQKDLTGAMLLSVLGDQISLALTPLQLYTFGVVGTIGIPCIIALGVFIREFGWIRSLILTIGLAFYGTLLAGLISKIISIF